MFSGLPVGVLSTPMKIAYVFDRPLPARQTDSEQALQTIAALSRRGAEVCLVLPANGAAPSARELAAHYQVTGDFEVVYAPTPFVENVWGVGYRLLGVMPEE